MEYSRDNLIVALDKASKELQAARVVNVYLDMEGSAWSGEYNVVVETEHKMGRETRMNMPEQNPETGEWMMVEQEQIIWFPELCPKAEDAVRTALSAFEAPENVRIVYIVRERLNKGEHVWPVYNIIATLNDQVNKLEDEIDRIVALVGVRENESA